MYFSGEINGSVSIAPYYFMSVYARVVYKMMFCADSHLELTVYFF